MSDTDLGCDHYKRKCAFVSPCCGNTYICRICHDVKEKHEINRHDVTEVECLTCGIRQQVKEKCEKCNIIFGNYFCAVCKLFDDTDKQQFHCQGCGICRVGGRENFFHCDKCDMCLSIALKETHKCVEKASKTNCPVCLEYLHTSLESSHIPPCGHLVHQSCFQDMLRTGNYACPTCAESMVHMESYWDELDDEINNTAMPEEYKDYFVQILCRDCHKESRVLFHVLGLKCQNCGSYNTCRTSEPPDSNETAMDNNTQDHENRDSSH